MQRGAGAGCSRPKCDREDRASLYTIREDASVSKATRVDREAARALREADRALHNVEREAARAERQTASAEKRATRAMESLARRESRRQQAVSDAKGLMRTNQMSKEDAAAYIAKTLRSEALKQLKASAGVPGGGQKASYVYVRGFGRRRVYSGPNGGYVIVRGLKATLGSLGDAVRPIA